MFIRVDILLSLSALDLVTVLPVSVCATNVSAQGGMFSAGDAYERFMGRWSRELAPLLVKFAGVRDGQSHHRHRSRRAVCRLRPGAPSRGSNPVRGRRCPAASAAVAPVRYPGASRGSGRAPGCIERAKLRATLGASSAPYTPKTEEHQTPESKTIQ